MHLGNDAECMSAMAYPPSVNVNYINSYHFGIAMLLSAFSVVQWCSNSRPKPCLLIVVMFPSCPRDSFLCNLRTQRLIASCAYCQCTVSHSEYFSTATEALLGPRLDAGSRHLNCKKSPTIVNTISSRAVHFLAVRDQAALSEWYPLGSADRFRNRLAAVDWPQHLY